MTEPAETASATPTGDTGTAPKDEIRPEMLELKKEMEELLLYTVGGPVLILWTVCSIVPLFSMLGPSTTSTSVLVDAVFLLTGALGCGLVYFIKKSTLGSEEKKAELDTMVKAKAMPIAGYGAIWVALFAVRHYIL